MGLKTASIESHAPWKTSPMNMMLAVRSATWFHDVGCAFGFAGSGMISATVSLIVASALARGLLSARCSADEWNAPLARRLRSATRISVYLPLLCSRRSLSLMIRPEIGPDSARKAMMLSAC